VTGRYLWWIAFDRRFRLVLLINLANRVSDLREDWPTPSPGSERVGAAPTGTMLAGPRAAGRLVGRPPCRCFPS
jgi:hypothetical protein